MSLPHDYAHTHVSGKSEYVDDRSPLKNELYVEVFYSDRAHAKITKLDYSQVLAMPEVVAVLTAKDLSHNAWGAIFQDQPILAENEVQFAGEPILLIAAQTNYHAQVAKKLVVIEYQDLPKVMSIPQAIQQKSFIGDARTIERGNIVEAFKSASNILEGEIVIQGHDHFYLESQACIAYPQEDGQLEIHSSTQHPTETQHVVAHAVGVEAKDVVCQVKRMGGGFGGKESQAAHFAAMAGLVAHRLKRPARLCLTKDDDMIMTGKRNPFHNFYKVAYSNDGLIQALEVKLYSDGGAYADLSTAIMERAMLHSDNSYFIANIKVTGQVCKTHHHSHTAFRGFGGPKGVATIEYIIEQIAHQLKMDPHEVRMKNLYTKVANKNTTHYGQEIKNNVLPELMQELHQKSDYAKRAKEIEQFNSDSLKNNDLLLRGISLLPVKFGISFTTRFLNQGNALVVLHNDGTFQISTGATEMGQGVNARIAEMVTSEMGLSRDHARVMPTRTDKNANTSPTAASSGTDLNGAAALLATRKIKYRLSQMAVQLFSIKPELWPSKTAGLGAQPELNLTHKNLDDNDPNLHADWKSGVATFFDVIFQDGQVFHKNNPSQTISFKQLALECYLSRVSLSDYAFYKIPDLSYNKLTGTGEAFLYFTQGAACSEVSINRDTGEVKVLKTDILMDLGKSINHDLDIGQISGAFVQGMGWVTCENLVYNAEGLLLSHAPSTYKIPNVQDTPREFKIELFQNEENYSNVRGTKAVGEPPLLLAISVWTAIQNALKALPQYKTAYPKIRIPATSENVLRVIYPEKFAKWDQA